MSSFLGHIELFTELQQVWKRFPVNYNSSTHELTWCYTRLSDIYHKLYKTREKQLYIDMQTTLLDHIFGSFNLSDVRYSISARNRYLDSHICLVYFKESTRSTKPIRSIRESRPILPLCKEGVLQNRSDICTVSNHSVCIKYIHTDELGPPKYRVYSISTPEISILKLIEANVDSGRWNLLASDEPRTICILEQY